MDQVAKLRIYNGALRRLGERKISALTENREPRRVLDDIWGGDNEVVHYALERGNWNFASKSVEGTYSTSITPSFGFQRAFSKPSDMRRLVTISGSEALTPPLLHAEYRDESGYWYCDLDTIYLTYVSDDDDYGLDASKWTEQFNELLEIKLAFEAAERITNSDRKVDRAEKQLVKALASARSLDTMAEGVKFAPAGSWVQARGGSKEYNRA